MAILLVAIGFTGCGGAMDGAQTNESTTAESADHLSRSLTGLDAAKLYVVLRMSRAPEASDDFAGGLGLVDAHQVSCTRNKKNSDTNKKNGDTLCNVQGGIDDQTQPVDGLPAAALFKLLKKITTVQDSEQTQSLTITLLSCQASVDEDNADTTFECSGTIKP
jgi:hypothetical protein